MTDAAIVDVTTTPFTMVGDPAAAVCVGDACVIPAGHEQPVLSRQLDEDRA